MTSSSLTSVNLFCFVFRQGPCLYSRVALNLPHRPGRAQTCVAPASASGALQLQAAPPRPALDPSPNTVTLRPRHMGQLHSPRHLSTFCTSRRHRGELFSHSQGPAPALGCYPGLRSWTGPGRPRCHPDPTRAGSAPGRPESQPPPSHLNLKGSRAQRHASHPSRGRPWQEET